MNVGEYGLVGRQLGHSYSPLIHARFGYPYSLQEVAPEDLEAWVKARQWAGYNVTMPYKQTILPFLDYIEPLALQIGAVNTVVNRNGQLCGYNTDYTGLQLAMEQAGIQVHQRRVLILGTGGAAKTAFVLCHKLGAAAITVVGRTAPVHYDNLYEEHANAQVIINATPVGMYPHNGGTLVDLNRFKDIEGVMDVVYNPFLTPLVDAAQRRHIACSGGWPMLVAQACAGRARFAQVPGSPAAMAPAPSWAAPDADLAAQTHALATSLYRQLSNVVLVGMPGSGKSTIGRLLAQALGKEFRDSDLLLEAQTQTPIPTLLDRLGEPEFRRLEREVIATLGRQNSSVIATGGGVVMDAENRLALQQNGPIIYLQRDLSALDTSNRPLSAAGVQRLYQTRHPLYSQWATATVTNNGTPAACVQAIVEALGREASFNPHSNS